MNVASKIIQKYNSNLWKHNKKWHNEYYSDGDVVHSKYSDMFVHERTMNLVKDVYLKAPIKDSLGEEFCNLLWKFVALYEEIKDRELTINKEFVYQSPAWCGWPKNEYTEYYEKILEQLYSSVEFNAIIFYMQSNNIKHYYEQVIKGWKDLNAFEFTPSLYYNARKITKYIQYYNIDLICISYLKHKVGEAKKENSKDSKRQLFNSVMEKKGLEHSDKDFNNYLEWVSKNTEFTKTMNRFKKMAVYAVLMS